MGNRKIPICSTKLTAHWGSVKRHVVKYGMNITHVLLNNNELGKISKEQKAGNWEVWQTSLHNPDFAEYANLCGAMGISVKKKEELDDAFSKALAHNGSSLVEINSDVELV